MGVSGGVVASSGSGSVLGLSVTFSLKATSALGVSSGPVILFLAMVCPTVSVFLAIWGSPVSQVASVVPESGFVCSSAGQLQFGSLVRPLQVHLLLQGTGLLGR